MRKLTTFFLIFNYIFDDFYHELASNFFDSDINLH